MKTRTTVIALAMTLGALSIAFLAVLQHRSGAARDAQVTLARVVNDVNTLQGLPWKADPASGGSPALARRLMSQTEARVDGTLARLRRTNPIDQLDQASGPWHSNVATLEQVRELILEHRLTAAGDLQYKAQPFADRALAALTRAGQAYRERAGTSLRVASFGSAGTIIVLVAFFLLFYVRLMRARAENERLLEISREEAIRDALTGLHNRRALAQEFPALIAGVGPGQDMLLAMFDLDGFKQYNDTFGHAAGDALLIRLADRLVTTLHGLGTAYRMGGDEFCVVAPIDDDDGSAIALLAAAALSEQGDGFQVGCSHGAVVVTREHLDLDAALGLADQRMYAMKVSSRRSATRQSADVLMRVLSEQSPELEDHVTGVARLASLTAKRLGLPGSEVSAIRLAAELHDVGKAAIPDALLNKVEPLDDHEWAFIRRHTAIGERIVSAAPSLAHTAPLIRASHERIDGQGYPDGLRGAEIPLGSRIIAICDAYDAMTTSRPYRERPATPAEGLAELRRCAGTQFDAALIETFAEVAESEMRAAAEAEAVRH